MKSNYKRIGDFIELVDIRNKGLKVTNLVGLSISKQFIKSVANTIGTDMENYKIIHKNEFACSIMQVRRDKKMPLALYKDDEPAIISQAYPVFKIREDAELEPEYLMMWFSRSEFDRHACFLAVGGVRGSLEWGDFLDMELPIPSIEKQRAIVQEYNTVVNRIKLNEQLNQKLEETAQALYKHWFVDFEFPIHLSSSPPSEEEYPKGEVVKKIQQEVKLHQVMKPQHQDANHSQQEAKHPQQLNNLPYLKTFRKKLRNNLTPAEATLWTYLKDKQLENRKFRRQHSFGNYILDFYCPSESLAIELDGQGHFEAEKAEYDRERDLFLQYYGIKVLRFENKIVFENLHGLLEEVKQEFGWKMDHPAFQAPLLFQEGSTLGVGYKSAGGKMVFNEELDKEIPEGWGVQELGNIIESHSKKHDFKKEKLIFFNTSDILDGDFLHDNYMDVNKMPGQAKKSIRKNDILYSEIRPANKRFAMVRIDADDYVVSTKLMVLRLITDKITAERLYNYLTYPEVVKELHQAAEGRSGTFPQITFEEHIEKRLFVIGDKITEHKWSVSLKIFYAQLFRRRDENKNLYELKELLLSKMSKVELEKIF